MIATRRNNASSTRLPAIAASLGDLSQRQAVPQRPLSTDSSQSIDNAYSLEHLFTGLHRRIRRSMQHYNAAAFHDALKVCARVFQSYASYNLNTIGEFARRLSKNARDNKKILVQIEQFHQQLAELRHCHSTFEAELLVTTLVIDFHENDLEQQANLPMAHGKFSPKSRLSKVRHKQVRQAMELKSQLRQTNEHLQILLSDEFNANVSDLWLDSEKYLAASVPFHDHHMTYILRLIPDVVVKFEYALQLCTKLFELESTMQDNNPQANNVTHRNLAEPTPVPPAALSPRSDYTQLPEIVPRGNPPNRKANQGSQTLPVEVARVPPPRKVVLNPPDAAKDSLASSSQLRSFSPQSHRTEPMHVPSDPVMLPPLFASSEMPADDKNDRIKLQLLLEQLDKRLVDERSNRDRLLNCIQLASKRYEQLEQFAKPEMLSLVMSDNPAAVEYERSLCTSDCHVYRSIEDELNIAVKEVQYRIDWIDMVRQRTRQWLEPDP